MWRKVLLVLIVLAVVSLTACGGSTVKQIPEDVAVVDVPEELIPSDVDAAKESSFVYYETNMSLDDTLKFFDTAFDSIDAVLLEEKDAQKLKTDGVSPEPEADANDATVVWAGYLSYKEDGNRICISIAEDNGTLGVAIGSGKKRSINMGINHGFEKAIVDRESIVSA